MVAVEIWEEDRNGYFSRSSIIVREKCGVAVPYTIRIKLAQRKWKTCSYKIGKNEKHFNLPWRHRVLLVKCCAICLPGYVTYLSVFYWQHRALESIKSQVQCFYKLIKTKEHVRFHLSIPSVVALYKAIVLQNRDQFFQRHIYPCGTLLASMMTYCHWVIYADK